ncbi:hypothetical protein D3C86_1774830 [compost metagenome]
MILAPVKAINPVGTSALSFKFNDKPMLSGSVAGTLSPSEKLKIVLMSLLKYCSPNVQNILLLSRLQCIYVPASLVIRVSGIALLDEDNSRGDPVVTIGVT